MKTNWYQCVANRAVECRQVCAGVVVLSLLVVLTGCSGVSRSAYRPNAPEPGSPATGWKVAVVALEEKSPSNQFSGFGLMPGVLFAKWYERYFPTAFGPCLASELRNSGLFETVDYYPYWDEVAPSVTGYDLIVTGDLLHDKIEDTIFTYGLSVLGINLTLFGLPLESLAREVSFETRGFAPTHPHQILWAHQVIFEESKLNGAYYGLKSEEGMASMDPYGPDNPLFNTCPTDKLQPQFRELRQGMTTALRPGGTIHHALNATTPAVSGVPLEGSKP